MTQELVVTNGMTALLLAWLATVPFLVRLLAVMMCIRRQRIGSPKNKQQTKQRTKPVKTVVVLGSGGHTTEMLEMIKNLSPTNYSPLVFIIASTDDTSERRLVAVMGENTLSSCTIYKIPRSREVGQSYLTSIATTLWSFVHALALTARLRPGLLLCNGPGTCLPVAICTLFWRVLGWCPGNIVFVESFCRVETLSLTGKLLYPVVDLFVIHWAALRKKYPRSQLVATFIPHGVKR